MNNVILLEEIKEYLASMQTGIKKVQRGVSTSATTITIDAVNMSKTFVVSVSKGSAGYVAARGNVSVNGSLSQNVPILNDGGYWYTPQSTSTAFYSESPNEHSAVNVRCKLYPFSGTLSGSLSSGSTDLTTKQYSAKLISSTQIQTDGACEWQVIEFM